MRTDASWKEQERLLKSAKALAHFANLEPNGVEDFRTTHRNFAPDVWWTAPAWNKEAGIYTPWIRERDLLRAAWAAGFPADRALELVTTSTFLLAHAAAPDTADETPQIIWPYQRAVLFLHVNHWRAKTCEWCGKRFVAEHNGARFCTFGTTITLEGLDEETTCAWAYRRKYKKEFQQDETYRNRTNKRRRQKYRLETRSKNRGSRHAKRKNLRQR